MNMAKQYEQEDSNQPAVDEELWRATFAEFKRQALRSFQSNVFDIASGGWVDVTLAAAAGGPGAVQEEWSDIWPPHQWCIAFEILFYQTPARIQAILPNHDDLLLFVYWADAAKIKGSRIFARRKKRGTTVLPLDLLWGAENSLYLEIDWRSTLILNFVLQSQYLLTVLRCPPWEVEGLLDGTLFSKQSTRSTRSIQVTKVVHASPSRTPVNLDQSKAEDSAPTLSYPDICFAVDDFVQAFDSLTLEDPTDCYCVLLYADIDNSWHKAIVVEENHLEKPSDKETSSGGDGDVAEQLERLAIKEESTSDSNAVLFNGYVSCRQLCTALRAQLESPLRALQSHSRPHTSKVLMRGPGGIGRADVAVTAMRPSTDSIEGGESDATPKKVFKIAQSVMKGVVEAAKTAVHAGGPVKDIPLQCALMSLDVPVEALAEEILKAL